jgi:hypothetical protein
VYDARDPAVSCNYSSDTFVVVWSYDYKGDNSDIDVLAQAVYGDFRGGGASQLQGNQIFVSSDVSANENYPSIICKVLGSSCLVVFQYYWSNEIDIYARRLYNAGNGLSHNGDRFVISDAVGVDEYQPTVAWGENEDEYLVAWLYEYTGYFRVVYATAHDTEQGFGANEMKSGTTWLINPGEYGGAFDKDGGLLDVDYNPNSNRYLVTYVENPTPSMKSPINGLSDVLIGVLTYPGQLYMDPTYLAYNAIGQAAVVANKTSDYYAAINEFFVGYPYDYPQDTYNQVMGMIVPDRVTSTNQRPVFPVKNEHKNSMVFYDVDITTKISNGNYFIVWQQLWASGDLDIYGRLISHGYYNFYIII